MDAADLQITDEVPQALELVAVGAHVGRVERGEDQLADLLVHRHLRQRLRDPQIGFLLTLLGRLLLEPGQPGGVGLPLRGHARFREYERAQKHNPRGSRPAPHEASLSVVDSIVPQIAARQGEREPPLA
jgi:hypothetical protein